MDQKPNTTGTISGDLAKFSGTPVGFISALRKGFLEALIYAVLVLVILQVLAAIAYGIGLLLQAFYPGWLFTIQDAWLWHANGQTIVLLAAALAVCAVGAGVVFGLAILGGWPRKDVTGKSRSKPCGS